MMTILEFVSEVLRSCLCLPRRSQGESPPVEFRPELPPRNALVVLPQRDQIPPRAQRVSVERREAFYGRFRAWGERRLRPTRRQQLTQQIMRTEMQMRQQPFLGDIPEEFSN